MSENFDFRGIRALGLKGRKGARGLLKMGKWTWYLPVLVHLKVWEDTPSERLVSGLEVVGVFTGVSEDWN